MSAGARLLTDAIENGLIERQLIDEQVPPLLQEPR